MAGKKDIDGHTGLAVSTIPAWVRSYPAGMSSKYFDRKIRDRQTSFADILHSVKQASFFPLCRLSILTIAFLCLRRSAVDRFCPYLQGSKQKNCKCVLFQLGGSMPPKQSFSHYIITPSGVALSSTAGAERLWPARLLAWLGMRFRS